MSEPKQIDEAACLAAVTEALGNARVGGYGAFIDAASDEELAADLYDCAGVEDFEVDTILGAVRAIRWR